MISPLLAAVPNFFRAALAQAAQPVIDKGTNEECAGHHDAQFQRHGDYRRFMDGLWLRDGL